jgi:hypothetical protein
MRWISKRSGVSLLACVAAGCASVTPREYRAFAPVAPEAAYNCAQVLVDSLGYTLRSSDRATGFLSGARAYSAGIFGERTDLLTVTILKQSSGQSEFHVTAGTNGVQVVNSDDVRGPIAPSDKVMGDAVFLLARCGNGSSGSVARDTSTH